MGFNEKVHAYIAAKYYVYLTEDLGNRGLNAFIHATQYYGMQRGRRMAQRAIREGADLTQASYNYFGEWVNTDEIKEMGCQNVIEAVDNSYYRITQCPWATQFKEMGLKAAGTEYCRHLDAAISRGFNPYLGFKVDQTLHTHDCCIQRVETDFIGAGSDKGKFKEGLRNFEYHCAHSYWAYREVVEGIFKEEGTKVCEKVIADFAKDYSKEMADILLSYKDTNFNVCD